MCIVMEKLAQRNDGSLVVIKKTISYSTAQKMVGNRAGWDGSTLAIFATVFCGCDHTEARKEGGLVWMSSIDSTNVYLEPEV